MYIKKFLVATLIIGILISCNEAGKNGTTAQQGTDSNSATDKNIETREAFFYRETMDIHNEVMAKMGKLNGYKKKVQQQSDSIRTMLASTDFPRPVAQRIAAELDSLDNLGKNLQTADSAMNAWMEGFNPDPQLASSDANAAYFEKQKKGAEEMKKIFFDALQKAELVFSDTKK